MSQASVERAMVASRRLSGLATILLFAAAAQCALAADTECALFKHGFEAGDGASQPGDSTLSGRLLDTNDFVQGTETPIVGATVTLLHTDISDTTDADGVFTLTQIGSTEAVIDMDTSTALPGPGGVTYAGFRERIEILPCADNVVERPFFLPRIDESSLTTVDPDLETVVTNANIGVSIVVPPHTAMRNGEEFTGQLSISEVPGGLAPAALPEVFQPGLLVTIQPVGVTFSTPVPITFPNTDSLPEDGVVDIWSLDPEAGVFVAVGRGEVSADGMSVETVVGGVRAADWHFALALAAQFANWENYGGQFAPFIAQYINGSSDVGVRDGSLRVVHELPTVASLDADVAPKLIYDSRVAYPRPVVKTVVKLPRFGFVPLIPDQISARLRVNFGLVAEEVFTDTSNLSAQGMEEIVQSIQFDASGLVTGVHFYDFTVMSHFEDSSVGAAVAGFALINNRSDSPFGAGWSMEGLDRLITGDDLKLVIQGDGAVIPFLESRQFTFFRNPEFDIDCCSESIATGDFNNDGYPDLVNIGGAGGGVVRLNDKNGGFTESHDLQLGTDSGHSAVTGFIDGDSNVDIAVSRNAFASSAVTVFLGDGAGSFTRLPDNPTGSLPRDLVLGDFNSDGKIDIVTANDFGGSISFLAGAGDGSFAAAADFDARGLATQGPRAVAAGDLDEDGTLDIAVTGQSAEMAILYGDGAGGFAAPLSYNANGSSAAIEIEDFNGDDNLDIAVTSDAGGVGGVEVFLGNGLTGFGAPIRSPAGEGPWSMSVGDLNQDGKLDIAVANVGSNTVSILLGLGTGVFQQSTTVDFLDLDSIDVDLVAIADFNQDLFPDLAVLEDGVGLKDEIFIIGNTSVDAESFMAPPHVFSRLFEDEDGSFRHVLKSGLTVRFDADGRQTARVDRFNNEIAYSYDGNGRVEGITYPGNKLFDIEYAANSVAITDPAGRQSTLILDGAGDLVQINIPDGGQNLYAYGPQHNLQTFTTAGGHSFQYQYNQNGMVEQVTVPNGEVRLFEPGLRQGLPEAPGQGTPGNPLPYLEDQDVIDRFTDGLGRKTEFTTSGLGDMTSRRDALNRTVLFERDERHLVTGVRLPTFDRMEFTYDGRGNLLTATDATGGIHRFQYNDHDLPLAYINPIGEQITMGYSPQGALVSFDDGVITLTNTYTGMGQLETQSDGHNNTTTFAYAADGNLSTITDPGGHVTGFVRDAAGNVTSATDDLGQTSAFTYDEMNRLLTLTDEDAQMTIFSYDAQGNLESITGPDGPLFSFEYDEVRNLTSMTDSLNRQTGYGYDVVRNLTSVTNPNGSSITYQYDALNRLSDVIASTGEVISYDYSALGKLVRMEDNDSLIESQHDDMGRPTLITLNSDGAHAAQPANVSMNLSYNQAGQLTGASQVDGTPITYSYDAAGFLSGITTPHIDHQLTVTNASRLEAMTTQITGGVSSGFVRGYTPSDQLELLEIDIDGATAFSYDITLDDIGRRTGITDNAGSRSYSYDPVGRLLAATHPDMADEAYSYDALGNRLTSAHTTGTAGHDEANQIEQDSAYEYGFDANGNLILRTDLASGDETHYSYNAFDQLVSVELQNDLGMTLSFTEYAYDAMGRRIMKTVDGTVTRYVHQNQRVVATYDGTDTLLATYLHGPEPNMPLSMGTMGEQFVFHSDPVGSVIAISDRLGSLQNEYRYDSFGRVVGRVETLDNPFGFTGAERDDESGLHFMRKRYYDPFTGRFIQADQRNFLAGLNVYHYVYNNPLSYTDPTGQGAWGLAIDAGINRLEQAAEGRSSAKDTKPLDLEWFLFDVSLGAATCGMGKALKSLKLFNNSKLYQEGVDLATSFTDAAVDAAFNNPDSDISDDDFIRDTLVRTAARYGGKKFASPFGAKGSGDDLIDDDLLEVSLEKGYEEWAKRIYKTGYDRYFGTSDN